MITQRFRHWLSRVFAWWPWRQSSPVDYRHDSGALSAVTPSEGVSLSTQGATTQQGPASATPYFSTLEERPAFTTRTPSPASNDPATPQLPPSNPTTDISLAANSQANPAPTPQQRLEFLRYLVRQGIVNEGEEEK